MTAAKILNYLEFLQDIDYLAGIVNSTTGAELCRVIDELLRSDDHETVSSACLFVRDLVLLGKETPNCQRFVEQYIQSLIVKTLEELVLSPHHFISQSVTYTLGKICSYKSIHALNAAFAVLKDTAPLVLPRIVGEIVWLGGEPENLIDSMLNSRSYTTRWAVFDILEELHLSHGIERLRQDSSVYVHSEGEYRYQLLELHNTKDKLSNVEYKRQKRSLEQKYKPVLSFAKTKFLFENYLSTMQLPKYSVHKLEVFIMTIV
jgi:hypothetical protein